MPIKTEITDQLGITHPILLAPMNIVSGARLTALSDDGYRTLHGHSVSEDIDYVESDFDNGGAVRGLSVDALSSIFLAQA